jgi:hypothetical protein
MAAVTQSERLSQRQTRDGGGRSINNEEAKTFDMKLKNIIPQEVLPILTEKYPNIEWTYIKQLHGTSYVFKINPDYIPSSTNSYIEPDGGIVLANGFPALITEAKKQGTNDKREAEGKCKQPSGNAIERAHKNFNVLKDYMSTFDVKYFPYLIFGYGCDFRPSSTIIDRLASMTRYQPYNQFLIKNDSYHQRASVFIQPEPFSDQFIIDKCIEATEIVLQHLNLV